MNIKIKDVLVKIDDLCSKRGLAMQSNLQDGFELSNSETNDDCVVVLNNPETNDRCAVIKIKDENLFSIEKRKEIGNGCTEIMTCENGNWDAVLMIIDDLGKV